MVDIVPGLAVGVIGFGLNDALTPVDGPETAPDRVTGTEVPEIRVAVTVVVVVTIAAPLVTEAVVGLTVRLKSKGTTTVSVKVANDALKPAGLPVIMIE
jgi:hypothetical protein